MSSSLSVRYSAGGEVLAFVKAEPGTNHVISMGWRMIVLEVLPAFIVQKIRCFDRGDNAYA